MAFLLSPQASAQGLTYVGAGNQFVPPNNLSPQNAIETFTPASNDNLWGVRDIGSESEDNGVAPGELVIFTAGEGPLDEGLGMDPVEDVPEITQTLSGLTPGVNYDVYAVYWSANNADWGVRAGFSSNPGANQYFNRTGTAAANDDESVVVPAQAGTLASSALFGAGPNQFSFGNTNNYLGLVGSQVADGSGQIQVFLDDLATSSAEFDNNGAGADFRRQWFDGLAFVEAGTGVTLSASVDLDTGSVTITNDTSFDVDFTSYTLASETTGSLNPQGLTAITGNFDGAGDSSVDSDLWEIVAPADLAATSATLITESENSGTDGATLAPGQTLNLGAAYLPSAFDGTLDPMTLLEVVLTLDSGQELRIAPEFVGTPAVLGDFDFDGDLDAADFEVLAGNLFTDVASLTPAERVGLGDLGSTPAGGGLDGVIDFNDVRRFQQLFDMANGAGAFAALTAIPEPSTLGLTLLAGVLTASRRRKRSASPTTKNANSQPETHPTSEKTSMTHPMKSFALAVAVSLVASTSAMAQVTLIDRSSDPMFDPNTDGLNSGDVVAASFLPGDTTAGLQRISFDDGETHGQSFEITNGGGEVQSIFWGYNDHGSTGPITLNIDEGNDGMNDFSFPLDITPGLLNTTGDNSGPVFFLEFDLSSAGVVLGDGSHNFNVVGGTESGGNFFFAPFFVQAGDNGFAGGNFFAEGADRPTDDSFFSVIIDGANVASLDLVVDTSDGTVSLVNNLAVTADLNFYQIESEGNGAPGTSLTPEGLIGLDVGSGSDFLAAGGNSESIIGEASLSDSLVLQPGESQYLGALFDPVNGLEDLRFSFAADGQDSLTVSDVVYVTDDGIAPADLLGDFNGDGTVNTADYATWRDNLGLSEAALNGNGNGDGVVTRLDYELFLRNVGRSTASSFSAVATPEPGAALLLALAGSALSMTHQRRANR